MGGGLEGRWREGEGGGKVEGEGEALNRTGVCMYGRGGMYIDFGIGLAY